MLDMKEIVLAHIRIRLLSLQLSWFSNPKRSLGHASAGTLKSQVLPWWKYKKWFNVLFCPAHKNIMRATDLARNLKNMNFVLLFSGNCASLLQWISWYNKHFLKTHFLSVCFGGEKHLVLSRHMGRWRLLKISLLLVHFYHCPVD